MGRIVEGLKSWWRLKQPPQNLKENPVVEFSAVLEVWGGAKETLLTFFFPSVGGGAADFFE